ncbi:MAG: lytic transglycosylase domain-containing protein [Kiritimatiellia bacterium]
MMPKRLLLGCCSRGIRREPRAIVLVLLLATAGPGRGDWEIDWDLILQAGTAVVQEVHDGFDGRHLRALLSASEIDWTLTGKYFDDALRGLDWDRLALLHPFAAELLGILERHPEDAAAADWLRQRIDYLAMAESVVAASRRPVAPPETGPSLPSAPPRTIPTSVQKVVIPKPDWDADTAAWLRRVPAQPSAFARQVVPDLKRIFEGQGIPSVLVWLAEVESSFNPKARSPAGAVGLFQFMPATAGRFGLQLQPEDQRMDPQRSALAAAQYLRILHGRFGDWQLALAAYNAGEGRVGRVLRQTGGRAFLDIAEKLPIETRMYVPRIAALVNKREQADIRYLPAPL